MLYFRSIREEMSFVSIQPSLFKRPVLDVELFLSPTSLEFWSTQIDKSTSFGSYVEIHFEQKIMKFQNIL